MANAQRPCIWLVVAFESAIRDPRDQLEVEYDGLKLYIKPSQDEYCDLMAVFVEPTQERDDIRIRINRFMSAMAWKDSQYYISRGSAGGGARPEHRNTPRFNYREKRHNPYVVISRFDFEHLQVPTNDRQRLALALYREALGANQGFYKFLSFFKILNIIYDKVSEQAAWINGHVQQVRDYFSLQRLHELQASGINIGEYLVRQGRNAIAHAFQQPIRDPDVITDIVSVKKDADLMQGLATVMIEEELGFPSLSKIWREHLYELEGFRALFGEALTARLKSGEDVLPQEVPAIPPLTINLKEKPLYQAFSNLSFRIASCQRGKVFLATDTTQHAVHIGVVLDFPDERLELSIESLTINRQHSQYSRQLETSLLEFLIDYFSNGFLQVVDDTTHKRLSHKTAFVPVNVDVRAAIRNFRFALPLRPRTHTRLLCRLNRNQTFWEVGR